MTIEDDQNESQDEELDLDGSVENNKPEKLAEGSEGSEGSKDFVGKLESHHHDLSDLIKPGATAEEIINIIDSVPHDTLIPWEECHLPSMGYYYGWPDGIIKVRAMGQQAEKILTTQRLAKTGQSIDHLFQECCQFPDGFSSSDLLVGDRTFLLYFLRGVTHGNMYEFAVTCPNEECETTNTHVYDLNDLQSSITPARADIGNEPFKVTLPFLSELFKKDIWVEVKFLRAYDTNDIVARRRIRDKTFKKRGGIKSKTKSVDPREQVSQNVIYSDALDNNMDKMIVSFLGDPDRLKIRSLISKLHSRDTSAIREWMRENTPGIDTSIEIVCPDCGHEFKMELPITEDFFRSTKRR